MKGWLLSAELEASLQGMTGCLMQRAPSPPQSWESGILGSELAVSRSHIAQFE